MKSNNNHPTRIALVVLNNYDMLQSAAEFAVMSLVRTYRTYNKTVETKSIQLNISLKENSIH